MIKKKKDNKGFTMIELIIVIAIIGIIGAILVPTYGSVTSSARLTTDLSTVKTVQQLVDLYYAEMGVYPKDVSDLQSTGYLNAPIKLQTGGNIVFMESGGTKVQLSLSDLSNKGIYKDAVEKLGEEKVRWIANSSEIASSSGIASSGGGI